MVATREILARAEERGAMRIKKRCVSDERRRIRGKSSVSLRVAAGPGYLLRSRALTYCFEYACVARFLHLTGSRTQRNYVVICSRLLGYRHHQTGEDNGDAHIKRQIFGREVVVAVTEGKLDFGPWEQIFYGEFDGGRRKRVLVKIIGD